MIPRTVKRLADGWTRDDFELSRGVERGSPLVILRRVGSVPSWISARSFASPTADDPSHPQGETNMRAPTFDQLERAARVLQEAAKGSYHTTLAVVCALSADADSNYAGVEPEDFVVEVTASTPDGLRLFVEVIAPVGGQVKSSFDINPTS